MRKHSRRGLTLVEVVVVLVCMLLLISLFLPAVNSRPMSKKSQCKNNLFWMGLAIQEYHSIHQQFPSTMVFRDFQNEPLLPDGRTNPEWKAWGTDNGNPFADSPEQVGVNWMIAILPFIHQEQVYDAYNTKFGVAEPANMTLRSVKLQQYLCPSDDNGRRPMTSYKSNLANDAGWGRSNYGATGAIWLRGSTTVGVNSYYHDQSQQMYHPSRPRQPAEKLETIRNSVMGFNGAASIHEVTDGLSKTVMVWELTTGIDPADPRGTWALGKTGSSIVGACWNIPGSNTTCYGINSAVAGDDDVKDCIDLPSSWSWSKPKNRCNDTADRQSAPRSYHKDGVHALFADGSVQFIHQKLDQHIGQALDTIMGDEVP